MTTNVNHTWTGAPARIIDPSTYRPVVPDAEEFLRQRYETEQKEHEQRLARLREEERQKIEQMASVIPSRYALMPGRVLIRVRPIDDTWDASGLLEMTEERKSMMRAHEPWGTILMVGQELYTDYGTLMSPDPEWVPGRQVMFNPAGSTDLILPMPGSGEKVELALVGFRGILMVDRGETATSTTTGEVEGGAV